MADYDKPDAAVDAELSSLASQLEALIRRIEDLATGATVLGLDEVTDRKSVV
mgnify:FL=1